MKKFVYLLLILLFTFTLFAHENESIKKIEEAYQSGQINYEESLLQKFYVGFAKDKLNVNFAAVSQSPMKCATHLIAEFRKNIDKLSPVAIAEIENLITPSIRKKNNTVSMASYISPYGKFQLTYSTTGSNAVPSQDADNSGVPDYVEHVANYFDHSWKVLIDTLGFKEIPLGNGEYYQIFFSNMNEYGGNVYGYTQPDGSNAGTEIVMHNTYQGFPSNTDPDGNVLGAAKVTAVHEFKHAIQFVYSSYWTEPGWFIEADATWAEDIGFDATNDYYNYLGSSQIRQPGRGLAEGDGYEDNLIFHFFSERYDISTNREIWERREQYNESVNSSVANVLFNYNAFFDQAFAEYYTWLYNCGNRYNSNLPGFGEAASYPTSQLCSNISTLPAEGSGCSRDALSGNFLVYNSQNQNQYLQLLLDTPSGNNYAAVIAIYTDGTTNTEFYELDNNNTFDLFVQPKLTEIDQMIIIPVVTSISGSSFDYEYSLDAFQTAVFSHTPFVDTEIAGDIEFLVNLETPQNLAYIDSLRLFYQINSGGYTSLFFSATGNANEYSVTVPNPGDNSQIDYYFRIADELSQQVYFPESAPDSVFSFFIGADQEAPVLEHYSLTGTTKYNFPLYVYAKVSDNIGLDSVYIEYRLNEDDWMKQDMIALGNDFFVYKLDYSPDQLAVGDLMDYKLTAIDISSNHNITTIPENDFYRFDVVNGFYYSSQPGIEIKETQLFLLANKDTITITDDISIEDLNIYFESDHAQFSDLEIRLVSPDGTEYKLFNQNWIGSSAETAGSPKIIFDSEALLSFDNALLIDADIAEGTFSPVEADLTQLNGSSATGNWIIRVVDKGLNSIKGNLVEWGLIMKGNGTTDVQDGEEVLAKEYQLYQNYPNPFNPSTQIKFALPQAGNVSVKVFDILGNEVKTLVNDFRKSGVHEVSFNASNLSSGIYFVRMLSENFISTKKIMLIK